MGVGSNSLDAIRKLFRRSAFHQAPYIPASGYSGYAGLGSFSGGFGFDYLNTTSSVFGIQDYVRIEQDLIARYVDYEDQDDSPLIASCYDIYADDSTQTDTMLNQSIWIEADNEDIRADLNYLLHNVLRIEENIWGLTRTLVKYGNLFHEIVARDQDGVLAINHLPPPTVRRIEVPAEIGKFYNRSLSAPETVGFIYDPKGVFKISTREFIGELAYKSTGKADPNRQIPNTSVFENWEVSHMRLLGKKPDSQYGFGAGEPARWIYKRLVLLEDSIILHRLTRSPSRYAFYIDVSGIPPQETNAYLNKVRQSLKRQKFVNPNTGKLDLRYAPMSPDEDFFLPQRDGQATTRVEPLAGPVYDAIEDVKFFENKLFAALKVPKPFLTYEESTAKTNLSAEDARFARTVLRIQRELKNGFRKICEVHLAARGINPHAVNFSVEMTMPSAIFELAQLEIRAAELDLADKFDAYAPREWVMKEVLGFSEEQIIEMNKMRAREQEASDEKPTGKASGSLQKALSKRGQASLAPESIRKNRNTKALMERIEELRHHNHDFDRKWGTLMSSVKEIQSHLRQK
jgi:Bacteriophage T4-like portal protein (Gp20)